MQKKLITLAMAGLMSSGAFAQMNVTVYGTLDLSANFESGTSTQAMKDKFGNVQPTWLGGVGNQYINGTTGATGNAASSLTGGYLQQNGSRTALRSDNYGGSKLGFKGTEDLGGGMKLDFVVETSVQADGNSVAVSGSYGQTVATAPLFGNNETSLALTTGVGQFKAGRFQLTAVRLVCSVDPMACKGPGGVEQMVYLPIADTTGNNMLSYTIAASGFFGGYEIALSETQGAVAPAATANSGTFSTLFGGYKSGPILVTAQNSIIRDSAINISGWNQLGGGYGVKTTASSIAGSYDFGAAKLGAMWYTVKSDQNGAMQAGGYGNMVDARTYQLALTVPMGAHSFKASYVNTDDRRVYDMDANSWGLGYEYALSKRTTFYSRIAKVTNSNGGSFGVIKGGSMTNIVAPALPNIVQAAAGSAVAAQAANVLNTSQSYAGQRTNAWNVGLQHSF